MTEERELPTKHLDESEDHFRTLADGTPVMLWAADVEGRNVYVNRACLEFFGLILEDVQSEGWQSLIHPEDRSAWLTAFSESLQERKSFHMIGRVRRHDGEWRWAESYGEPRFSESGGFLGMTGSSHDVTERKRAEEALREAEQKYRELVRYAPAGIYEVDFRKQRFTSVNEAMCLMLGYSREELLAVNPFDMLDEEGRALFQARIVRWLGGEEPDRNVEFRVKTKDGRTIDAVLNVTFTADEEGRPLGATVVAHDITQRKQRERRIGRYNRVLQGINRIFEQAIQAETEEAVGNTCLAVALEVTGSRVGFVGEMGEDGLLHDVAISDMGEEPCRIVDPTGHRRPPEDFVLHGLYGRVIDEGQSFFTNDLPSHPVVDGHPSLTCFLGVPLTHESRTIGILAVANREGGYSQEQQEDLEALAPAVVETLHRKRAEVERERLLAERTAIMESMTDGLTLADTTGRIVYHNPASLALHGYSCMEEALLPKEQVVAQWELLDLAGDPVPVDEWPMPRALRGDTFSGYELLVRRVDMGREFIGSYSGTQVRDAAGTLLFAMLTVRDITERKRTEEDLRQSREQFRIMGEALDYGVWLCDEKGRANYVSDSFLELLDMTMDEVRGFGWNQRLVPEDVEPMMERWLHCVRTGEVWDDEHRIIDRHGKIHTILTRGKPVRDREGKIVSWAGINLDITERKQAEEALRRYTERLRFLHKVDEAILTARSAAEVAQAVVQHVPRLLPCRRASVVTHNQDTSKFSLLAVYSRDGPSELDKGWCGPVSPVEDRVLGRLMRGEGYVVEDVQALSPCSPLVIRLQTEGVRAQVYEPILIHGQFAGLLSLSMDIPGPLSSEQAEVMRDLALQLAVGLEQARLHDEIQRHAEELEQLVEQRTAALEASEARFRTIFEEAAIGIALVDAQGELMATNPALQRILGYGEQELDGAYFFDLAPGVKDEGDRWFQELLAGERDEHTLELQYVRKDGKTGEANVTLSLLQWDVEGFPLVLALVEDITERKRAQEALIQAERLTVMGRMAASLAHEINNPIQSVVGCLGLAMEVLEEGEDASRYMDVAMSELGRAARIVHRMRDLGRREEEHKEPVSVGELIEKVVTLTRNRALTNHVEIVWEGGDGLSPVPMVRDRVQQVFLNLVLNAIDAMPGGGELRIQTARTKGPPGVRVSFTDTGVGIASQEVDRIFEAFHSTKELGLGLGLYVSRTIVQEHGGWIEVQSEAGRGATFTVWLPAG